MRKNIDNNDAPIATSATKSNTSSSEILRSMHLDFVHDLAFDHYGRRIATCSGDRTVKVWDLDDKGEWVFHSGSDWQAHKGSVTRLSWAHPEFGQLLATCGSDHAAIVWEEREGGFSSASSSPSNPNNATEMGSQPASTPASRWVAKATISDARKAVTCVQFAPRHLGLKLATGSADGLVRIYEAIDVMNLNHWPMNSSIEAETDPKSELGVTSLSWCTTRFEPPTLVVGGSSGRVSVYRYSDATRQWILALDLPMHSRGVLDVAWAPNLGRSFHLIASAGKDNILRIHRIKRRNKTGTDASSASTDTTSKNNTSQSLSLRFESSQVLDTGVAQVWRCAWNCTGTVLASSGDGGIVQLWKCNFHGVWKCVSEVDGDLSEQPMQMLE